MRLRAKSGILLAIISTAAAGAFWYGGSAPPAPIDWFDDMTERSGLQFTHRNGEEADLFAIIETLGGGVGLIDYDQDGLLDIFVTGGGHFGPNREVLGHPNRLFRNEGAWRFREVTAAVGLPAEGLFYSHGCAVGDYDNDGWPDLAVTGYGRMALYRNDRGRFVEVTAAAGLDKPALHWSTSAAWGDVNGDGHLDLFVCHYVDWSPAKNRACVSVNVEGARDHCDPLNYPPLPQTLFLNRGDGVFEESGTDAGLVPGKALAALIFDANNDGLPDIYVANDMVNNFLYVNKGSKDGAAKDGAASKRAAKFQESGLLMGVAVSMHGNADGSMGVAAADYNGTGLLSLFVTNYQDQEHCLYRNLGNGFFQNCEHLAGLSAALGRDHVGWGTGFYDFDLDGAEDLFVSHGHLLRLPPERVPLRQPPALLRNLYKPGVSDAHSRFEAITARGGKYFRTHHIGRGAAFGDLDNDGGIDIVICHTNEPVTVLRNQVPDRGRWLGIDLVGKPCRDAVGARLTLEVGGRTLTRQFLGGGSYLSANDRRIVFGLGQASAVDKLTVRWPSGRTQTWEGRNFVVDAYHRIVEEAAEVERR